MTDSEIRKTMLAHLDRCNEDIDVAFSPEGVARMHEQIIVLNNGKAHQPIYKVRVYESLGAKFAVGTTGNKSSKYVETDKGTNLFYAVYQNNDNKRNFRRDREGGPPNNLLNYGYAILRAIVARGLVTSGLLPTLGIHHHNRYNAYLPGGRYNGTLSPVC